jgi:hypothetical protein
MRVKKKRKKERKRKLGLIWFTQASLFLFLEYINKYLSSEITEGLRVLMMVDNWNP